MQIISICIKLWLITLKNASGCSSVSNVVQLNEWQQMVSTFIRTKLITFVIHLIDLSDLYVKIQNLTGNT